MAKQRQRPTNDPFKRAHEVRGKAPAILMYNPRNPHNIGTAVRNASCYDIEQVWISGTRCAEQIWDSKRIPREERMKGFKSVQIVLEDDPFAHLPTEAVPVAVELLPGSQNLFTFEHPENAVYVFGPEDGTIPGHWRARCHQRVFIPTRHCLNLSVAIGTLLYDRKLKQHLAGAQAETMEQALFEDRGRLEGWPNPFNDLPEYDAVR